MSKIFECPYIHQERKNRGTMVYCEACVQNWPDLESRNEFINQYCANHPGWQRCPMAQVLNHYYEREDTHEKH